MHPSIASDVHSPPEHAMTQRLQDFEIASLDGSANALAGTAGKVVLIVNVASRCGYTPQYTDLVALQNDVADDGFSVVGVPCNQFGGQEPGTPEEIRTFCETSYGVNFPLTEKIDVNGPGRHPLYAWLTRDGGDIQWNFEKFLIGGDGQVIGRYPSGTSPRDPGLLQDIAGALEG
jgi:glutathione peroxidase